ncbi:MAG TPA: alternative ribosome rescue aminoacyl-tRNA hydrolase ArfB [Rubrivivax sp.]|nr:alternative ribosome rescue aminoacyl-tRNA hydrolase ArfB [Rubrivivax sp.]
MIHDAPLRRLLLAEADFSAVRAQGPGGQNVNKVSNAAQLRFDVRASSLPEGVKARLLGQADQRISADGVIVIKAQQHRSLTRNRAEALQRLAEMVQAAQRVPRRRQATRPTLASVQRRLQAKAQHGRLKAQRGAKAAAD